MNIHLSRPGGQREGPYTLDEINRDLAANKYRETDFWAWYEGLTEWVPLHQVPGIVRCRVPGEGRPKYGAGDTEVIQQEGSPSDGPVTASEASTSEEAWSEEPEAQPEEPATEPSGSEEGGFDEPSSDKPEPEHLPPEQMTEEEPSPDDMTSDEAAEEPSERAAAEEAVSQEPTPRDVVNDDVADSQPEAIPPSLARQLYSGMPFDALEQILLLSSGDPQVASRSVVTSGMLEAVTGEDLPVIREKIPRDVMGGCVFLEKLRGGGSIPEVAWRAASKLKPEMVRQAREGLYRICVRTYPIETGEIVALFLFYNKQSL